MNAKEFQYNDVVINGFVALFVNLAILPLLIVMSFVLFKGSIVLFLLLILFLAAAILMIPGYFSQEPKPGLWYSSESTRVPLPKPVSFG